MHRKYILIYRMGHEKVGRVRRLDWCVKAKNIRSRTTSGGGVGGERNDDSTTVDWLFKHIYAIYIIKPERISQGHVQKGRRATFSWPILYIQQDATLQVYLSLETALRVSCGIFTHHQEHTHLYLQYLVPAAVVEVLELLCISNSSTIATGSVTV